jgi:hypothetical protein
MKLQKLFIVSLVISSLSLADACGRSTLRQARGHQFISPKTYSQNNIVEFELSYDFSVLGDTHKISFTVVVPQDVPDRQNILRIQYSPKPSRIFDENENRYAEFVFVKPDRQTRVEIDIKAELFRYDLLTARRKRASARPEGLRVMDFLEHEKHIEKDHEQIQEIANTIEGQTELDRVKHIYDHVIDNMEYAVLGRRDRGAIKALQQGKGDCTEYSDLFVAICRAKNIPARVVTGYTVKVDTATSKHNWVEVYLQDYGWVPFDPSSGDVENVMIRARAFGRMRPAYIYLSHIRNDEVLDNHNLGKYKYWGDRVRPKDSIEFKLLAPSVPKTR